MFGLVKIKEGWINPVDGVITSTFGERINPLLKKKELHDGIDISVPIGTDVVAVKSGIITEVKESATFGKLIKYKTNDGYTIMYAHLDEILVKVSDKVEQKQIVAKSGNTGLSTGAHLHYSVWENNILKDPFVLVSLPYTTHVKEEFRLRGASLN